MIGMFFQWPDLFQWPEARISESRSCPRALRSLVFTNFYFENERSTAAVETGSVAKIFSSLKSVESTT